MLASGPAAGVVERCAFRQGGAGQASDTRCPLLHLGFPVAHTSTLANGVYTHRRQGPPTDATGPLEAGQSRCACLQQRGGHQRQQGWCHWQGGKALVACCRKHRTLCPNVHHAHCRLTRGRTCQRACLHAGGQEPAPGSKIHLAPRDVQQRLVQRGSQAEERSGLLVKGRRGVRVALLNQASYLSRQSLQHACTVRKPG